MQDTISLQTDSLPTALEQTAGQVADSIGAGAAHIVEAIKSPSGWEIASSLSVIAVAALAIIEVRRIYLNRKEGQERAAARVSAVAIPVRRQIKSWLDEVPPEVIQMEERLRGSELDWSLKDATAVKKMWHYWDARSRRSDIGKAEQRIENMNAEAPSTEKETRSKVVGATAAFYRAFDNINQLMALPWADMLNGDLTTHVTRERGLLLSQGHKLLRQCAEELDALVDKQFDEASL